MASTTAAASTSKTSPALRPHPRNGGGGSSTFSESLGLDHILSLASAAAGDVEERNQGRVKRNKEAILWKKEKGKGKDKGKAVSSGSKEETRTQRSEGGGEKKNKSTSSAPPSTLHRTKSTIKADLKAKKREKTRLRKEKRKLEAAGEGGKTAIGSLQAQLEEGGGEGKKKKVSFA